MVHLRRAQGTLICESVAHYHLLIKIWICKRELEQSAIDFGIRLLDSIRDWGIGLLHIDGDTDKTLLPAEWQRRGEPRCRRDLLNVYVKPTEHRIFNANHFSRAISVSAT